MITAQMTSRQDIMTRVLPESSAEAEAYHFPQGMAGFSDATQYGFIYQGHGDIICIQCIDRPEAAFLLTPWDESKLGNMPELTVEQCRCIGVSGRQDVMWMLVLNPFADAQWVTANLKAPVALNLRDRLGLQCIRPNPELDIRFHWMPQPG